MEEEQLESVRLDAETKIRLATLKKRTGIENWNTLCRWAFCLSLSDPTVPRDLAERNIGAVEMTWKTFAGEHEEVYRALLVRRTQADKGRVDRESLGRAVRQHIARGTARLVAKRDLKSVKDLLAIAVEGSA